MPRALLIGCSIVLAACSSSTASAPLMVVTLAGPLTVQGHDTTDTGQAAYTCQFPLTLTTTGGYAGEVATFDSAGYQVQLESGLTYSGELAHGNFFYPSTSIAAGDTLLQNFKVVATGPFQFSALLYYSAPQGDEYGQTAYTAACE